MTGAPLPDPADARAQLRIELRARRRAFVDALDPAGRDRLEAALAALLTPLLAPLLTRGRTVASYAATGAEIDPQRAVAGRTDIAFPRVLAAAAPLAFHRCAAAALRPGWRGIPEPPATAPPLRPDIVLVPLLAATPAGDRLGQGGGFYDRTLAQLRAEGPLLAIGLGWEIQIVDSLPWAAHDARLDWIATPARLIAGAGR